MPEPITPPTPVTPPASSEPAVPAKFLKDGKPDYVALTAAYTELEKKLGGGTAPASETPKAPETPGVTPPKTPETPAAPTSAFAKFESEFVEKGSLSEESYTELQTKFNMPKDVVNDFIKFRQTSANDYASKVIESAGGQEAYGQMVEWAKTNFAKEEADAFDGAVKTMDLNVASTAIGRLKTRYEAAMGKDPKLLGGGVSNGGVRPFSNMKEAVAYRNSKEFDLKTYNARLMISDIV